MNVFLPSTALKKIVFLEYIVASGNADCALLFDGFSLYSKDFFNLRIRSFIVAFLRVRRCVVHYASI